MKKILMYLVVLLMACTIVSCKKDPGEDDAVKRTVVKYCNWNLGTEEDHNLLRRRVEQFNKESKTIRIQLVVPPTEGSYDEFIMTLAAGQELPDVFMVNSVPTAVINQWAIDITTIAKADSEWEDIPESLRESITYGDHIYGVPAGQYYMGLYANLDLIGKYIIEDPETKFTSGSFTTDEWIATVKSMRDINHNDGTGVIGMNAVGDMINWLPSTLDKSGTIKHFVWNGSKFDFTNDILLTAFEKIADLGDPSEQYVYDSVPISIGEGDEQREYRSTIFGAGGASDIFLNGQLGFIQEGSWASTYENTDFNCKFVSYPDGKVVTATDYLCISKTSKNPEAAFEVAKYLTFGRAGLEATYSIIDNNKDATPALSLTGIPLNTSSDLSDRWFTYIKMNGLEEIFNKIDKGELDVIVEGNKYVPGFQKARYLYETFISIDTVREGAQLNIGDFIWEICCGNISVNDYRTYMTQELCDSINAIIKKDYEAMGITYK